MSKLTFFLQKILAHQALTQTEAYEAMETILTGADAEQVAAFLTALKYRGESQQEILGMFESIQRHSIVVSLPCPVLDIVGTGGDMANTVNISTGAALLLAACGVPVVKHGNRSVSSQCGSADVLEALGVNIDIPPNAVSDCLKAANIAFLYAPSYNPILKKIRQVRRNMRISTVFNLLGPLLNPTKPTYLLLGVAKDNSLELLSDVILQLSHVKTAIVYHGNGLDELTTVGGATGYLIAEGRKTPFSINPETFGFKQSAVNDLCGGNVATNAKLLMEVFSGKMNAIADTLILNAGVALTIYGKTTSFEDGFNLAQKTLQAGKAMLCLDKLIHVTHQYKKEKMYG